MQAGLAPILAASAGGTAAAGAGAAVAGTGFTQAALLASAAAPIMGGISQYQEGRAAQEAAEVNADIGRTRAMQTDITAREGLGEELATLRATLGANGQGANVGTTAFFDELRTTRGRDRRIEYGNRMQEVADARTSGRNAAAQGRHGLMGGFTKSIPSLNDLYQLRRAR